MNQEIRQKLKNILVKHEGCRSYPYYDTTNNITIGIGRNLTDRGVLPSEIDLMFNNDIEYFYNKLMSHFDWFALLNMARQIALVNMCFMGFQSFLTFVKMIEHLAKGEFSEAADEILNSLYAKQVGERAVQIAQIIRLGEII